MVKGMGSIHVEWALKYQTLVEYSHKSYATIVLAYMKEDKVLVKDFCGWVGVLSLTFGSSQST